MCNVHLIKPIRRPLNAQHCEFMRYMLLEGARNNRDDWGVASPSAVIAERGQYKGQRFESMTGQPFIIGHNRLATQGLTSQPIKHAGWTLAHNGIFSGSYEDKADVKSDSLKWLEAFAQYMTGKKHAVKSLAKFMSKTTGSFSLFLINPEGRLFYMKSDYTKMTFKLLREGESLYTIAASTDEDNITGYFEKSFLGFPIKGRKHYVSTLKPDSYTIYEITDEGINPIKRFTECKPVYKYVSVYAEELTPAERAQEAREQLFAESGYKDGYALLDGRSYDY